MPVRIVIDGREVRNPLARFALALVALLLLMVFLGLVVFVILPLIGVVVTLSLGTVAVMILVSMISALVLAVTMALFGRGGRETRRLPWRRR